MATPRYARHGAVVRHTNKSNSSQYDRDAFLGDEEGQDNLPPPRKDRHKQDKQKKKKRTHAEASMLAPPMNARTAIGSSRNASLDEEDDADAVAEDDDDEADDEKDSRRAAKKIRRYASGSGPASRVNSANHSPKSRPANGPSRLILRLPNNNGNPGNIERKGRIKPASSSSRFPRTVTSSPVSSPELALAELDAHVAKGTPTGFQLTYASDDTSEDDFSELDEDDGDEDVRGSEEAYLIADKLKKLDRKLRKSSQSPNLSQSQNSDNEQAEINQADRTGAAVPRDSIMLEIARIRDDTEARRAGRPKRASDGPVTWSGAEDEEDLDNLDSLLGLTANESAALVGHGGSRLSSQDKTMRFEDFMAADDGDESDSSSDESDQIVEDGLVNAGGTPTAFDTDADNEHIETTLEVVQNGGFVFYKGGSGESTDDEVSDECASVVAEEDGGDTTDTLDDTDHLGLVRFGIEAVDEDDEEAEEALQHALMDRHMSDARNMGLSVSMQALAEHPELVIAQTAKTLGVSVATAAKILTSVGMSILMTNDNVSDTERSDTEAASRSQRQSRAAAGPSAVASRSSAAASSARSATESGSNGQPVLGSFEPAGDADLCVVVKQSELPAPSPFSARKRRRPRAFTDGSPHHRGQSVVSSISSHSFTSARPYNSNSSEEPQYNIILDLDDLVDLNMLPGASSSGTEDEIEIDDATSVSTALGPAGVGDTSRWARVPIGAFRSAGKQYNSLGAAVFNGTRNKSYAHNISLHGGLPLTTKKSKGRHIPVSPVLFPAGHSLKAISEAKSRKERRMERKQKKGKKGRDMSPSKSLQGQPSADISQVVSPLFSGVASGVHIPPLSLGDSAF